MIGKDGVENAFDRTFSEKYNIHRTRQNFPNAVDNFTDMATLEFLLQIGLYKMSLEVALT